MKKNVAGQKIGAQILNMDGTVFTSVVTVYVCGDAGTQAIGASASGSCTLEGNGFYTYGPNQSETNYDHIGFTFIGASSIPVTLQVYTNFPQTGDSFPVTSTNLTYTSTILTNVSVLVTNVSAVQTQTSTIFTNVSVIQNQTSTIYTNVSALVTNTSTILTNASSILTLTSATFTLAGEIPTSAELVAALAAADDAMLAAIGSVTAQTDQLTFTVANELDVNAVSMNDTEILGTGQAGDLWRG